MISINGRKYELIDLKDVANKDSFATQPPWYKEIIHFAIEFFEKENFQISTSGSTGSPKNIHLTKDQLIASAKATIAYFGLHPGMNIVMCLPSQYIGGKMMLARAIVGELNLITVEPSSNPLAELNTDIALDFAAMTPMQVQNSITGHLASYEQIDKVIIGGAPISNDLLSSIKNLNNSNYGTYGMTETISHVAVAAIEKGKDMVYEAVPGVSFQTDEENCLIINAPHLSLHNLLTNDIVDLLNESQFEWIGRKDNVINSGGLKIHPESIEKKLQGVFQLPYVVTGIPDAKLGTKAVILVEGKISDKTLQQKLGKIHNLIPGPERPREIICLDEFVYVAQGKIDRKRTSQKILN